MKTTSHVDDPISNEDSKKLQQLLEFDDTNFIKQAKLCGFDPATADRELVRRTTNLEATMIRLISGDAHGTGEQR